MAHAALLNSTAPAPIVSTTPEPAAFDTASAARYLGIGKTTLFAEIKAGRLPARKAGNRTLIVRTDADAWLAALPARNAA
ncbi:excisionase family DNA-binding protein [Xanthobacter versatilis]|uniref:excisionase family DNA-binding protein n=1 Tax=Xanthobacter autotrophicus (strain ATCC BAA-1158 / Py2) TaxID=78245 RepID=UPI00372A4201